MTDNTQDRIRVAEVFGWTDCFVGTDNDCYGVEPGNGTRRCTNLPDPFTSADDANALKEFLRDKGWIIEIKWQGLTEDCPHPAVYVELWREDTEQHERSDSFSECDAVSRSFLKTLEDT